MPGAPICSWDRDDENLSSDDDMSDNDSMPELIDDDDEIIYEREAPTLPVMEEPRNSRLNLNSIKKILYIFLFSSLYISLNNSMLQDD